MNKYTFEAKNIEEATEKALTSLNTSKDNLIINVIEEKNTLLKKLAIIEVIKYNDVIDFIKENISEILKLMGIEVKFEVRRREDNLIIKLFSNNNAILIGKNGATIQALQVLIRQITYEKINKNISILLDVEDYKEKKQKNIEYLAKKTAKEVAKTKVEAKLDSMNSYERRIVHSILSTFDDVYTESVGEEPNRCVVIKPREM